MKRLMLLLLSAALASCASAPSREEGLIDRALQAMGGLDALAGVKTLVLKGSVKHWEPEQSMVPGGEMRYAAESNFEISADFATHATRVDWVKKFVYPAPRTYTYSEIVTPEAGCVLGVDSTGRNRQSMASQPPAHSMSGLRLAATQRELRRMSPSLLLEMRRNGSRVSALADIAVAGRAYPALAYKAGAQDFIVLFDPATGLPARVRTLDYDGVWGDVNYDLVFSDWKTLGGQRIAAQQQYELNGRVVADIRITEVSANPTLAADRLEIPAGLRAGAARPATGNVPYQWVLRRQFIGTYLDSENASYDTTATSGLRLVELAPGVDHVVGGSHNSLVVELGDALVVFDAPVSDWQSNWVIGATQAKYPGKPVKYLVQTHHHMDHTGGLRAYLAQGATLVVGKGAAAHYRNVLAAPFTRNPDLATTDLSRVSIVEVADRYAMTGGKREVSVHLTENPHASAMLIGYVADARIGFVTDIWSPGRDPLPAQITSPLAAVVNAVKKAGISPVKFAGGHGSSFDYAPLAGLAAKP